MRKVSVRQSKQEPGSGDQDRLVALVATGLQRLLQKQDLERGVDFRADESVTTTCPGDGAREDERAS